MHRQRCELCKKFISDTTKTVTCEGHVICDHCYCGHNVSQCENCGTTISTLDSSYPVCVVCDDEMNN